jgi:enoyl-CoA hydratase/carnithine racemase
LIALFCDLRIASDDAVFGLVEEVWGQVSRPVLVARKRFPASWAFPGYSIWFLTNRILTRDEALQEGLED